MKETCVSLPIALYNVAVLQNKLPMHFRFDWPSMKQLYSAKDPIEAHAVRTLLSGYGIDAEISGDNNAAETGSSLPPILAPCVFVREADFDRACSLLDQFSNDSVSHLEENVEVDSTNGESESPENLQLALSRPSRSSAALFIEILIVLAATMPILAGHSILTLLLDSVGIHSATISIALRHTIRDMLQVSVVLLAIRWSGERWSTFGLKKLASADWVTACIVCFVATGLTQMGQGLFLDFLKWMFDARYVQQLITASRARFDVYGSVGLVTLFVFSFVIGFTEELLMRGYLLTRLEQLLRSTWMAVLLSSVVFGLMHWLAGPLSMCHAFLAGIVYGIAFAWTRTLWPVVIAHALYDFSIFLHHAA